MTKSKKSPEPTVVEARDPSSLPGTLKALGGSKSDTWNNVIANQTIQALWRKNSDEEGCKDQVNAAVAGLIGVNAQARQHRNGAAHPRLQHETGNEHYGRWRIDGSDPSIRSASRAPHPACPPQAHVFLHGLGQRKSTSRSPSSALPSTADITRRHCDVRKVPNSGNGKLRKQSRQAEYARLIAWQRLVN